MAISMLLAAVLTSAVGQDPQFGDFPEKGRSQPKPISVLVFSKTAGFRHDCIPVAHDAIQKMCDGLKWTAEHTEDATVFNPVSLQRFDVVIFECTTGDCLNNEQQTAFEGFVKNGGGYVGIHAASDTEYDWPWYGKLVGAWFKSHPAIQEAVTKVEDRNDPSTRMLPEFWKRRDEWYSFRSNPRGQVHVLASLDESTYQGGGMGDHPIMWKHEYGGGRAWYNAMGHVKETYADPLFMQSLSKGIEWAAGKSKRKAR